MPSTALADVFVDLHRVSEYLVAAIDTRLAADCELTLGRFEVLAVVSRVGFCRVNDIADDLGITWGGTSKIVDRLEAAQLCKRRPNPEDGRSSLIELTASGRRALAKATKAMTKELDQRVGSILGVREVDQLAASICALRSSTRQDDVEGRSA